MDNGTREGLEKFLKSASNDPDTVLHYEFMQDYKVRHHLNACKWKLATADNLNPFYDYCVVLRYGVIRLAKPQS